MSELTPLRPVKQRRLSRDEKARDTYKRLLESAAQVVGEDGYADASVSKITRLAGVAQGTFYNYFETRQDVLDRLLPYMGRQMLDHIGRSLAHDLTGAEREEARFRAFFDYLNEHPAFYRILYEAEIFAPDAHDEHFRILVDGYKGALGRAVERGEIKGYSDQELEAVIYMLLSARSYLAMRYVHDGKGGTGPLPGHVIDAYVKFVTRGLFAAG
ncbi:TetR/AcrR family transcriptional regulator [Thalassobaculum sp.]|uniref:TetR/AcrR family transcriptional regulator n=1 Tax=Thalassobaculum sp. TaxID=2022740 RepID=UPI0032EBE03D